MAREAMMRSQPMSSPVSSKMQAASFSMSQSKQRPTAGFAVMPLVPSEPPQTVPTTSSLSAIGTGTCVAEFGAHLRDALEAGVERLGGAAGLLDHQQVHGAAAGGDGAAQFFAVEAFAAQGHEQHGAHVGMRAQALHHLERVLVRIAAGKADEMHVVGAGLLHDEPRDVVRAFDQVGDGDDVADALAAVLAQEAFHGGRIWRAHQCPSDPSRVVEGM